MKFSTLFTSSFLLSLSHLISVSATTRGLVEQNTDAADIYVNALGEVVAPAEYPWGHFACKKKHAAAEPKALGHRLDASGRLGKRQATCPSGYVVACDAYSSNPCCPSSSPVCCTGSTVCCGTGQFCQGVATCCEAGQVGCGEACCNYGETCCGDKCCGATFTCSAGTCVPPPNYTTSLSSSSSSTQDSYTSRVATGPSVYVNPTPNNTESYGYGTNTLPPYTSPTCTPGPDNSNPSGPTYNSTTIGAISGCLSALSLIFAGIAAWFYKKKTDAEHALAEHCKDQPTGEKPPAPPAQPPADTYTPPVKEPEPYTTPNEGAYVERPITGTPGMGGHGAAYN